MFDERAELIEVYRGVPSVLRALLRGLPDEALRARGQGAGEEEWSVVEVVCHLRDAEERSLARVRRMRDEDRPALPGYDQAELARTSNYRDQSVIRALERFARLRAEHVALLEALAPEDWERCGEHEESGEITVTQLTAHMARHDAIHLAQIARQILQHGASSGLLAMPTV
ncbi:MAG TPA: DinB family protein [Thermomicrobiaceae bacterium]|nr:DinB family protein [Thermomicrobiaceae bacterium]